MMRVFVLSLALTAAEPALKISPLENGVVCVQTTNVTKALAAQLPAELTNQFSGLVLDLRFATGPKDFTSSVFLPAQKAPVVVLVNAQTHGAAAEWAAQLRTAGGAILIGSTNAIGKIMPDIAVATTSAQEKNFQQNPFAVAENSSAPTNDYDLATFIDHTSEAELVRRRVKDGDDDVAAAPRTPPAKPVIQDPALARALDLLKALAVLKPARG
jgi:hypothetical protein